MHRRWRPVFRSMMMWQRARRGWSVEDTWSFDCYLAKVIAGGVRSIRERSIGYPGELTPERWEEILLEIEQGMDAAIRLMDDWDAHDKELFDLAMKHLHHWFFGLWD